jgi:dethiobiotin synthetase
MVRNFLITGTTPRAGKSIVACALGFAFAARGLRVGVLKPAETGCREREGAPDPADTRGVMVAASCALPLDLACPYRYRAALVPPLAAAADGAPAPDRTHVLNCFGEIASESDVVLVEDVGGLAAPIAWNFDCADLAAAADLDLVVVVANRVGCVNATALTLRYAEARGLGVAGYLINDAEPEPPAPADVTARALAQVAGGAACLGSMRHKEPLKLAVIEALLARAG